MDYRTEQGSHARLSTRTLRATNRYEIKYLVPEARLAPIRAELRARMELDSNGVDGAYRVWRAGVHPVRGAAARGTGARVTGTRVAAAPSRNLTRTKHAPKASFTGMIVQTRHDQCTFPT